MKGMLSVCLLICSLLLLGGCSSSEYIADQKKVSGSQKYLCGNALMGDFHFMKECWEHEDYLLPHWLDRSLNTISAIIDLPFSLVFDIVSLPYQMIVYSPQKCEQADLTQEVK